jgi:hypothetical protein
MLADILKKNANGSVVSWKEKVEVGLCTISRSSCPHSSSHLLDISESVIKCMLGTVSIILCDLCSKLEIRGLEVQVEYVYVMMSCARWDDKMKRKVIHEPRPLLAEGISRFPGS